MWAYFGQISESFFHLDDKLKIGGRPSCHKIRIETTTLTIFITFLSQV